MGMIMLQGLQIMKIKYHSAWHRSFRKFSAVVVIIIVT